jgi:hypothetical protein
LSSAFCPPGCLFDARYLKHVINGILV